MRQSLVKACRVTGMSLIVVAVVVVVCWQPVSKSLKDAATQNCIGHQGFLIALKSEIAAHDKLSVGATISWDRVSGEIAPNWLNWTSCPSGGTYSLNPVGEPPSCSVPWHKKESWRKRGSPTNSE